MSYIASNNGLTYIWKDAGYVLQAGEVDMGEVAPTPEQLAQAFPNYATAKAAQEAASKPTKEQAIAKALAVIAELQALA